MIKNWIVNLRFVREYYSGTTFEEKFTTEEKIYQKAFADALNDLKETNVYDTEKKAEELANKKLNDLLSNVDLNKIVTLDKQRGIVYIGGEKVDEGRLGNLKAEAEFFLQSDLWQLIHETPKELAQRQMFVNGETLADLQKGKSILYVLSVQKNIVETVKGFIKRTP